MFRRVFKRNEPFRGSLQPIAVQERPRTGVALALGGGAARGWAHIGVLRALDEGGIPISMIAGTSIGALVGGCYLAGKLDALEEFACSLTRRGIIRFLDFSISGAGLIGGMRLNRRLVEALSDMQIESLPKRLVCVATEARTGHEVWIDSGSLVTGMRASYALPGVFLPVKCGGRMLMDGALVNPVPVAVCRVYEEPLVVAVNLNYDLFGRAAVLRLRAGADKGGDDTPRDEEVKPDKVGIARSMVDAFGIIQDRISRARLAGDPPDLSLHPRVRDIGLSEFFRAREAIDFGYAEAQRQLPEIARLAESLPRR
ncbi:patatin-like phospholipase family protein [Aureimonas altamirensis]|uniref:patatin-like phospholipase family protein n=1 Tax=Aureimonas altamirensis TaxID=370622 RepID=UPI0007616184|nr:patatin-like phospholipase family protein [Aureimonas altamirensis]